MPDVGGKRVLVKPNLIDYIEAYPVSTAPGDRCSDRSAAEHGAGEIVVGDGPGFRRDAWPVVEATGLAAELARRKVAFVDLDYDDPRPVPVADGWFPGTPQLWLPRHVREAQLIVSVPKLKTHHWAGVSLSLKNLFGIVPGTRYGWPKNILHINGITPSILAFFRRCGPGVGGGWHCRNGGGWAAVRLGGGARIARRGARSGGGGCHVRRLMGFSLKEIPHLAAADWAGVGQSTHIETRGASEQLIRRYERPPGWGSGKG